MRLTGFEIQELFATDWDKLLGWRDSAYLEGDIVDRHGEPVEATDCVLTEKYTMLGVVLGTDGNSTTRRCSVATLLKKWRLSQHSTAFVVRVAKEDEERFCLLMATNNWISSKL